jgi:hypothetical protein
VEVSQLIERDQTDSAEGRIVCSTSTYRTPTHTWKDFFIHIATIVAALIAVALAAHTALARGA